MRLSRFKNNWTKLVLVWSVMGSVLNLTGLAKVVSNNGCIQPFLILYANG
ncbi:MAG TPA: hypothetical protein PKY82_34420 [Pyrinomonadaceae bacterium]|nr:hypothetical protein [Pyrinomonadaceae bacterium]